MINIPLAAVQFDVTTQVRVKINDRVVSDYAEQMEDGVIFPPADVFIEGDRYYIGDGWHRFLAAHKNGDEMVGVTVHAGGRAGAIRFALSANAKHGLTRSTADKYCAVKLAVREFPGLSDHILAQMCAVSHPFVGKVRGQLETVSSSNSRLGADGKVRRMPVPPAPHDATDEVPSQAVLDDALEATIIETTAEEDPLVVLRNQLERLAGRTGAADRAQVRDNLVTIWDEVIARQDDEAAH